MSQELTIFLVVLVAGLGTYFGIYAPYKRKRDAALLQSSLSTQANSLEALLLALKAGPIDDSLALEKDEVFIGVVEAGLLEVKRGSTRYEGGSIGGGARVGGGFFVGGSQSRGQFIKNPDEMTLVDLGVAKFTNQRVIFSGSQQVRIWDFDKLVDFTIGDNAINVMIKVSNNRIVSGLQTQSMQAFGPGFLYGVAYSYFKEGKAGALEQGQSFLDQVRASQEENDISKR